MLQSDGDLNMEFRWLERNGFGKRKGVAVLGGGEGSGPLFPPPVIDEDMFTADIAADLGISLTSFPRSCLFSPFNHSIQRSTTWAQRHRLLRTVFHFLKELSSYFSLMNFFGWQIRLFSHLLHTCYRSCWPCQEG